MSPLHVLDIDDLSSADISVVLDAADEPQLPCVLSGRSAALVFQKPSCRTRNAAELAVVQLGGHPVVLQDGELGIDQRESAHDVAHTLSLWHAVIAARVFRRSTLEDMASVSEVPIVNLLTDDAHPTQALADLLTLRRRFGSLDGIVVGYVGDFNNVARSLALALARTGGTMRVASPAGYGPSAQDVALVHALQGRLDIAETPLEAVADVQAVYTDTWVSMHHEDTQSRRDTFGPYQVTAQLMDAAAADACFLHDLPAHRGQEVVAEVFDGPRSAVWEQAANRLHAMRGLLWFLSNSFVGTKTSLI